MPSDREARERRRDAIREILISKEPVEHQGQLVELLRVMGIPATQSSVSRDLRDIGAVRLKGHYTMPTWDENEKLEQALVFVREVRPCGPHMILLNTDAGAAPLVAQVIDEAPWEDVLGTVAGDNSVLVLTENAFDQRLLYLRLKHLLREDD